MNYVHEAEFMNHLLLSFYNNDGLYNYCRCNINDNIVYDTAGIIIMNCFSIYF